MAEMAGPLAGATLKRSCYSVYLKELTARRSQLTTLLEAGQSSLVNIHSKVAVLFYLQSQLSKNGSRGTQVNLPDPHVSLSMSIL